MPSAPWLRPYRDAAAYVFVKPLRALVTVNDPSSRALTLIQYAVPLCAGGGGAPAPAGGGVIAAIGISAGCSSTVLATNIPGDVYSWPLSSEKWICHRSSRPGAEYRTRIASGCPPLRVPLFISATRARSGWTRTGAFETGCP